MSALTVMTAKNRVIRYLPMLSHRLSRHATAPPDAGPSGSA